MQDLWTVEMGLGSAGGGRGKEILVFGLWEAC